MRYGLLLNNTVNCVALICKCIFHRCQFEVALQALEGVDQHSRWLGCTLSDGVLKVQVRTRHAYVLERDGLMELAASLHGISCKEYGGLGAVACMHGTKSPVMYAHVHSPTQWIVPATCSFLADRFHHSAAD